MLHRGGAAEHVFARHGVSARRRARAVQRMGARDRCARTRVSTATSLTAVMMPTGHDADAFRQTVLERFDMSLGTGLGEAEGHACSASATSATSTI